MFVLVWAGVELYESRTSWWNHIGMDGMGVTRAGAANNGKIKIKFK